MTDNCAACRWWAPCLRREFIGVCGHAGRPTDRVTDRLDTCKFFELREEEDRMKEALA
jgi:hypothetical protein